MPADIRNRFEANGHPIREVHFKNKPVEFQVMSGVTILYRGGSLADAEAYANKA